MSHLIFFSLQGGHKAQEEKNQARINREVELPKASDTNNCTS
jgi:hypothetical protein